MAYGLDDQLPVQNDELVRRLSLRWMRACGPHNVWAKKAKRATEFLEGKQWSDEALAEMQEIKRSALTLNKIAPLWRLVMGYQSSNRMDMNFLPTSDSQSREEIAQVLTAINKIETDRIDLGYTDSEVFADGLTTGRGIWDTRLDFENNDFGELKSKVDDPFCVYIDPDTSNYDLDSSDGGAAYIQTSLWTDIDHIGSCFGLPAMAAVADLTTPTHTSSLLTFLGEADISPVRFFGQYADDKAMGNWADVYHTDFIDHQAKRLRLLDSQYKIMTIMPCFIDLETGDKLPIPEEWLIPKNRYKIQAMLDHAQSLDNPVKIARRPVRRVRWTVTCADVLLFDGWSPYPSYTKTGYFPYFRRGATRGMIDDLIDPQMEINKKRSVMVDVLNRSQNSGWVYEDGTLDPEQEQNLRRYGASPGIHVKWKRGANANAQEPRRLEPGNYPQGLDRLEDKAANDLHEISGINESALGQLDQVQSGRAIEARQRQAVLSIQLYTDNFTRSKKLQGRKHLEIYQNHYTEQRVYRVIGEDSKMATYEINKKVTTGDNSVTRMNDITLGRYSVSIDEVPISATFKQGQFEEVMMLLEKLGPMGAQLAQTAPELIIDMTSLPRKDDWKKALGAASQSGSSPSPELQSEERIAAAKNETTLAAAAISGIKDPSILLPELKRLQGIADANAPPQQVPPAPASSPATTGGAPAGNQMPVGPDATTPEQVAS